VRSLLLPFPYSVIIFFSFGVELAVWKGCVFMFITGAAPNARSLGATNGLSQTTVSVTRAVGKVIAAYLFAFSKTHEVLGGYAVFVLFVMLAVACLIPAMWLPEGGWEKEKGCVE
jgi:hypothetical protein